jgi:hypothetical protein
MAIAGTLGARLYTSATALTNTESAADAIGDFTGLTIATEIGLIESMGEFGKLYDLATFQAVGDGRMRKLKGGFNEGNLALVCGLDLSDSGQAALKTYADAANQNAYPFKLTIVTESGTDTYYFGCKVMSFRTVLGSVNNVVKVNISLEITTGVFTDAS